MKIQEGNILLSATDLMRFQSCVHATSLDLRLLNGENIEYVEHDASTKIIQRMGDEHEERYLKSLYSDGHKVVEIDNSDFKIKEAASATHTHLRTGADFIFQGAFFSPPWSGYSDFLQRVEMPSELGEFSYEVIDTKLKRKPDPKHLLQLCLYSDLLAPVQGVQPYHVHLVLGDGQKVSFRTADFRHYASRLRSRLESFVTAPWDTRPEPVPACDMCRWRERCKDEWDRADSLCLVANISRSQRRKLEAAGVKTLTKLARLKKRIPKIASETIERLVTQARLQRDRRKGGDPSFELRPLKEDKGLARIPKPSTADLFFDMEGDPLVEDGLEYLFGVYWLDGGEDRFDPYWGHDRDQERKALLDALSFFYSHTRKHPKSYIYHYANYEVAALKRLCGYHGVGEAILDQLLREQRFVDLFRVVGQGVIASEKGYSIKDLEAFYMEKRDQEITTGADSIVEYERYRETGDETIIEEIRKYNEIDCRSTKLLRDWLVDEVRPEDLPWFQPEAETKEDTKPDEIDEQTKLRLSYRKRFNAVEKERGKEVTDLVYELMEFHRREDKPKWWAMFDRAEKESIELIEDPEALAGLVMVKGSSPEKVKRSKVARYTVPDQETKLRTGDRAKLAHDINLSAVIEEIDDEKSEMRVKFGAKIEDIPRLLDLIPSGPINNEVIRSAIERFAEDFISGDVRYEAIEDLLYKRTPGVKGVKQGQSVLQSGVDFVESVKATVMGMQDTFLPIQGPPGTGKTYVSSHAILELLRNGKRVGVASNSHKAINNLLSAIEERAAEEDFTFSGVKKISKEKDAFVGKNIWNADKHDEPSLYDADLVAGTTWLFSRPDHDQAFDYLFVDEAGQVSLANAVALGTAARNLVLVGDQMQLTQPMQGAHPNGTDISALEYCLDGHATVPNEMGVFLPETRRMHPDICRYISDSIYEGRLNAVPETARQQIILLGDQPDLQEAGIRFVDVAHSGNAQSSEEEAARLKEVFDALLMQQFKDRDGKKRPMTMDDILVVAPYNVQVNLLAKTLPDGARVGTIDKFQGQEAPVCLISMTTSGGEEMPRNMDFLFSPNRLNVAVSRAQALTVIFASPQLLNIKCNTVGQMKLANTLCAATVYGEHVSQ